jgi:hypothetical protein
VADFLDALAHLDAAPAALADATRSAAWREGARGLRFVVASGAALAATPAATSDGTLVVVVRDAGFGGAADSWQGAAWADLRDAATAPTALRRAWEGFRRGA